MFFSYRKWGTIQPPFFKAHSVCKIHHMDIKTFLLNAYLKEDVFMTYSKGYVIKGHE